MHAAIALPVTEDEIERIIAREVRRFRGTLPGYDVEDLRQECRIVVHRRLDPTREGARSYVAKITRSALSNLLRNATTQAKCPHDAWGRPRRNLTSLDATVPGMEKLAWIDTVRAPDEPSEDRLDSQRAITYLREHLDPRDFRRLVDVFVDGAEVARGREGSVERIRAEAESILRRMHYRLRRSRMSNAPDLLQPPSPEEMMACYPDGGQATTGYDPKNPECADCADKATCLPLAIQRKLTTLTLAADLEVKGLVEGRFTSAFVVARIKRRYARADAKEAPLPEELPTWEGLRGAPAPVPAAVSTSAPSEPEATAPLTGPDSAVAWFGLPPEEEPPRLGKTPASEPPLEIVEQDQRVMHASESDFDPYAPSPDEEEIDEQARQNEERAQDSAAADSAAVEEEPVAKPAKKKPAPTKAKAPKKSATKPVSVAKPPKVPVKKPERKSEPKKKAPPAKKPARAQQGPSFFMKKAGSWPTMAQAAGQRVPLPSPRRLSEEQMLAELEAAQAKLGANVELDYGMQIVRKKRDGSEIIVKITRNGFEMEVDAKLAKQAKLESAVQLFGSLSSAAMWVERRMVSGMAYFNIAKNACTEIRSVRGKVIDRRGSVPG